MLIMNIPKNDDAELYGLFYRNRNSFLFLTYSFFWEGRKKESDSKVDEMINFFDKSKLLYRKNNSPYQDNISYQ